MMKPHTSLRTLGKNLLFPRRCIFCRRYLPLSAESGVCVECLGTLPFCLAQARCPRCGRPLEGRPGICPDCRQNPGMIPCKISAPYRYEGAVRSALLRFKQERYRGYADTLAEHMAVVLLHDGKSHAFDAVISAPPRPARMRSEGYDQAEHLARALAARLNLLYLPGILRQKETRRKQSALSAEERRINLRGNITVTRPQRIVGKHLLLVDDICTTGSTLYECTRVLRSAGAASIYGAVAATTPIFHTNKTKAF